MWRWGWWEVRQGNASDSVPGLLGRGAGARLTVARLGGEISRE